MKHISNFKLFEYSIATQAVPESLDYDSNSWQGKDLGIPSPKMKGGFLNDDSDKDIYAIFTRELLDRKSKQRLRSFAHDAYHIKFDSKEELEKLKEKYPVGAKYKEQTIVSISLLNSKTLGG